MTMIERQQREQYTKIRGLSNEPVAAFGYMERVLSLILAKRRDSTQPEPGVKEKRHAKLYSVRHACKVLGVSYPAFKQWFYKVKIRTVKMHGGYYSVHDTEFVILLPDICHHG